ncbi:hypothetical protein FXO37_18245 [Capsicum annuum]|nr:hypothetical protein FXO37_18245 [Capsicum annuum]
MGRSLFMCLWVVSQGHKPIMGRSQLICTGGSLMVTVQYSNDYKDDKNEALHTQYMFRTDVPHGGPAFHAAGTGISYSIDTAFSQFATSSQQPKSIALPDFLLRIHIDNLYFLIYVLFLSSWKKEKELLVEINNGLLKGMKKRLYKCLIRNAHVVMKIVLNVVFVCMRMGAFHLNKWLVLGGLEFLKWIDIDDCGPEAEYEILIEKLRLYSLARVELLYKSDILWAIWNPSLNWRKSPKPKCANRVGVSESDTP